MNKRPRTLLLCASAIFAFSGCKKTDQITVAADGNWTLNGAVWEPEEMARYFENPPNRDVSVSGDGLTFEGTAREFSDESSKGIAAIILEAVAQNEGPENESDFGKAEEIEQRRDPFSLLEPEPNAEQNESLKP